MILSFILKAALQKVGIPGMIGFLALGIGIRFADSVSPFLTEQGDHVFELLGELGIITLLFSVGLKSNFKGLVHQLRTATGIWFANVVFSGALGWIAARWVLDLDLIPSLFITIALSATSVGVPLAVWEEKQLLNTHEGELFVDVAELDDLSAIVFMAILFLGIPILLGQSDASLMSVVGEASLAFFLKFGLFGLGCTLFSLFVEERVMNLLGRFEHGPDPMLSVIATGVVIAALAQWLGLSLAIGAFFAGLAFSRDPRAVHDDASFAPIYEFLVPFFFIHIGLMIQLDGMMEILPMGGVLLLAAFFGKYISGTLAAWPSIGRSNASIIGMSLVPRAEIAMIVMMEGVRLGPDIFPENVFSAMVFVCAATCLIAPAILRLQLRSLTRKQS